MKKQKNKKKKTREKKNICTVLTAWPLITKYVLQPLSIDYVFLSKKKKRKKKKKKKKKKKNEEASFFLQIQK